MAKKAIGYASDVYTALLALATLATLATLIYTAVQGIVYYGSLFSAGGAIR